MSYAVGQARPLRWLVVAPFSVPVTGRFVSATGEQFRALMTKLGPWAQVEIPEALAGGRSRSFKLELRRPRDFRIAEVIKAVEPLGRLWDIADELERVGKLDAALAKLRTAVGEGPLFREALQLANGGAPSAPEATPAPAPAEPSPAPAPAPAAAPAAGGSALDAIFGKADLAPAASSHPSTAAKSGLDAFIGAMRNKGDVQASVSKPADRAVAKQVADVLRRAAESAALAIMASPAVTTLESSWQGLRMVVSHSPGSGDLAIDMLDTNADGLVSRLRPRLDAEPMERPDAVFVAVPIASAQTLRELAELGARSFVPIVVEVPDEATGMALDDRSDLPPVPEAWAELRREPASQWLCAAANAVVLANEEVGIERRIVFGSPVWGLAAMLSASVGQTGGPGHVFGRAGALVGPASHDAGHGNAIATERPTSVDQLRALGERGVLVLGSERGSDRLRLAAAPTVHAGGSDDLQLPGRILAGRAARFTRAVRDELPPHATAREVAARLAEAATNFLPRGPRGAVALQVRTDEKGNLAVDASISAALAGASFEFSSDL
jgi:hypothetical protein